MVIGMSLCKKFNLMVTFQVNLLIWSSTCFIDGKERGRRNIFKLKVMFAEQKEIWRNHEDAEYGKK